MQLPELLQKVYAVLQPNSPRKDSFQPRHKHEAFGDDFACRADSVEDACRFRPADFWSFPVCSLHDHHSGARSLHLAPQIHLVVDEARGRTSGVGAKPDAGARPQTVVVASPDAPTEVG